VGLKELDDGFVRRDDIIETMRKVKRSTTEERMADMRRLRRRSRQHPPQERARKSGMSRWCGRKGIAEAADRGGIAEKFSTAPNGGSRQAGRGAVYEAEQSGRCGVAARVPVVRL